MKPTDLISLSLTEAQILARALARAPKAPEREFKLVTASIRAADAAATSSVYERGRAKA
jgi:hypothetical protein